MVATDLVVSSRVAPLRGRNGDAVAVSELANATEVSSVQFGEDFLVALLVDILVRVALELVWGGALHEVALVMRAVVQLIGACCHWSDLEPGTLCLTLGLVVGCGVHNDIVETSIIARRSRTCS